MGLLDSVLDVPERLRVWQQAGVHYFYLPEQAETTGDGVAERPELSDKAEPDVLADPSVWPDPWTAIFAKAPTRPRIVITYFELGLDLTGQADPRRGALWRKLIVDLGLSGKNTVAFWPVALPEEDQLIPRIDIFLAGLARLAPGVLAIFGTQAAKVVSPCFTAPQSIPHVLLPDPSTLLGDQTEAWDHVLATLGDY
ncbi:MAG: hypothetical protein AB9872_12330 [Solidesulfovibrio sp.]